MGIVQTWLIALAVVLLFLIALYLVIKLAVKNAFMEIGQELARKVWDEDEKEDGGKA